MLVLPETENVWLWSALIAKPPAGLVSGLPGVKDELKLPNLLNIPLVVPLAAKVSAICCTVPLNDLVLVVPLSENVWL